ncbi:snake venom metalloproteinase fibrolase-like [Epargyreus clarus]|uniref:snake venom metalloproteinase fibrolase-like n=1 Tax=Epargyreus clarus TaxID=520877 RepID=UPI003C2CF6A4
MKPILILLMLVIITDFGNGKRYVTRSRESASVEYLTRSNQVINIPIIIHMDPVLTLKLSREYGSRNRRKLKEISHKLLKEVESFYQHRSLNQTIRFRLIETRFLRNKTNIVAMDENASKYLKSYCDWQSNKKMFRKKWYYSVLLTALDLYYVNNRGEEVRRSTGRGYMGGMCSMRKSCTLIEWHPKNIGFLLAHEIAHSLNINHDGPPFNHCKGNNLMSVRYNAGKHPKTWSPCSQMALKRYLQSGKSWCIRTEDNTVFNTST